MSRKLSDFQIFAKPASYRCNLQCSYCYYLGKSGLFAEDLLPRMADDLLEAYIRGHIAAHPGKTVHFSWHGGEPTLLGIEYFQRIVQLQQQFCPPHRQITNGIQTNGTLLDDNWADFLARNRFSVGLSLDGPAETHDFYRSTKQGGGSHAAAMHGYSCLVNHRIVPDILCVVSDHNVMFPLQVYRFFTGIGAKYLSFLPLVERTPDGVSDRTVAPEAYGAFLSTVFDQWLAKDIGTIKVQIFEEAARAAFRQDHSLCLFRPTCGEIPVVEYNGDVYTCDHFVQPEWCIGNLRRTELAEILASDQLAAFGDGKRTTLPQVCRSCEVLAMCNGECPKNRFIDLPGEAVKGNYLCSGYKLFFTHCAPFVQEIARQWQRSAGPKVPAATNTGRNDPCTCGSGRKFKKCCGAA